MSVDNLSFTLGPLPTTTADFWLMLWDNRCLVIVMLTSVVERGAVKCHQYWEKNPGESVAYSEFMVETIRVDSHEGYSLSLLELTNVEVKRL